MIIYDLIMSAILIASTLLDHNLWLYLVISTNKHLLMTHSVFGINLSCCVLKQILHNFRETTFSSTMQRSPTMLYMMRVETNIVHVNKMYKS